LPAFGKAPPKAAQPSTLPPEAVDLEDDLPAVPTQKKPDTGSLDLDLPSPAPARTAAPAPTAADPAADDLPALATDLEWGMPEPARAPDPLPKARPPDRSEARTQPEPPGLDLDLPDLPGLGGSRGADLPALGDARSAGLPALGGDPSAGLPAVGKSSAGLPAVAAGLPSLGGSLPVATPGVPSLKDAPPTGPASFGELDLDFAPGPPGGGTIDLGPPSAPPSSGPASRPPAVFGEISRNQPPQAQAFDPLEADPFGEASIPGQPSAPPGASSSAEVVRAQGGGTSYGEVNLDGGVSSSVAIDEPAIRSTSPPREEDMEFGAVPQQPPAQTAQVSKAVMPSRPPVRRKRWPVRVFGGLLVVAVGGGSLAFVPDAGPYGAYFISDKLNANKHARLLADSQSKARRELGRDVWPSAERAFSDLDAARSSAKRYHALSAYVALTGYLRELRFGSDPAVHARSKVLLDEIGDRPDVPYRDLALVAREALEGDLARALSSVRTLAQSRGNDPDVLSLAGEIELRGPSPGSARALFKALDGVEKSARAAFGMARASHATGEGAKAVAFAKVALGRSPDHVGARILIARVGSLDPKSEAESLKALSELLENKKKASRDEIVAAETLFGDIHLGRSRVALAEAAYGRALAINPRSARALTGLGETLFRAGRYSDALARFESSRQVDPKDISAQIGVAKSKLSLERIEEAQKALKELAKEQPKSAVVALWNGRAAEAAGDRDRAGAVYHAAIEKAEKGPELIDVYVALAVLQNERGLSDQAQKTLADARAKLPESSALHRALGDLALLQGRNADAVSELERALELDPEDLRARFRLGVAERRSRNYEAASKRFDEVAKLDPEHPGLALERGLIFEATGHAAEALAAYDKALAKSPTDPELMLRAGCGSVSAGQVERGEELLRKVLTQRPNSAEVNHCLGRSLLARDKLADAQRLLDRATEIDPNRAEYHLYAGWAANEAGNAAKADKELARALELDSSLGDAYWQRGVLRARQGAVRDAVADLTRALALSPNRVDVHASLADAYYDLGREREALSEWQKAVDAQPDNAVWRFRYGKLLVTNQLAEQGRSHLEKAIAWAQKAETPPRWLWEAHHFMARALAGRPEAATHWEQFLRLGPRDSPYRSEAKQALAKLGKPWSGD
jgi:tetratricopeptide (TPR) repeat protein